MGFIDTLKERAKANVKTIVLQLQRLSLLVTKKLLKRVQLKTDMTFPAHRS